MPKHEYDYEICNSRMRPLVESLVKKYEEIRHVDPSQILFVANNISLGKRKTALAKTSRIPFRWTELLYQTGGGGTYFHMMEFYCKATEYLDTNQMVALVYRELRTIGPGGEIIPPDIQDWWQILMGLGRNWFYPDESCPNLLDETVDWKKLMGSYYEEPQRRNLT